MAGPRTSGSSNQNPIDPNTTGTEPPVKPTPVSPQDTPVADPPKPAEVPPVADEDEIEDDLEDEDLDDEAD